ncbi:MAG: Hpt domain-containing protein [Clostridiales bacterium]|nr:Hpt domain-containing protein [Clostridiales bacterium]
MLTIDDLKSLGANTDEGLTRCMGMEEFYLRMVKMALSDDSFEKLREAVQKGDLDEGFERAHALKGVLTNVALTSLADPVIEMTEQLRARNDIDYSELLGRMEEVLAKYRALL